MDHTENALKMIHVVLIATIIIGDVSCDVLFTLLNILYIYIIITKLSEKLEGLLFLFKNQQIFG